MLAEQVQRNVPKTANPMAFTKVLTGAQAAMPSLKVEFSNNAQAHSPFSFPQGVTLTMNASEPLFVDMLNRAPVSALAVVEIKTSHEKEWFRASEQWQALRAPLLQYSDLPIADVANPDGDHWEAELGDHGWVGIYRAKIAASGTKRSQYAHYLVGRAAAGLLNEQYYQWSKRMAKEGKMTVGELAQHPNTHKLEEVSKRNVLRLLYNVSRSMGVEVEAQFDRNSYYHGQPSYQAPLMAVPLHLQLSNTMRYTPGNTRTEPTVRLHSGTSDVSQLRTGLVMLGPHDGVAAFPLRAEGAATFPVGVRKNLTAANTHVQVAAPSNYITPHDASYVGHSEPGIKHAISNMYDEMTGEHYKALKKAGWDKNQGYTHFKPVAVVVAHGGYERPSLGQQGPTADTE